MTDIINRAKAAQNGPLEYLIYKSGRGWYRPNSSGYTSFKFDAGRYSEIDAIDITHPNGPDGPRDGMFYKHQDQVNDHPSSRVEALEAEVERLRGLVDAIDQAEAGSCGICGTIRHLHSMAHKPVFKSVRAALNNNGDGE